MKHPIGGHIQKPSFLPTPFLPFSDFIDTHRFVALWFVVDNPLDVFLDAFCQHSRLYDGNCYKNHTNYN